MSTDNRKDRPDPERVAFLRSLPLEIKESITGSEAEAFIYGRDIPETLFEKIRHLLPEE